MGKNELIVEIPYRKKRKYRKFVFAGKFWRNCFRKKCSSYSSVSELAFGEFTQTEVAFLWRKYRISDSLEMEADGKVCLETTKFRVPLLSVCVDDGENKKIAFSPYIAEFPVKKGKHLIKLTAYGNRINTFGTLHNCNEKEFWCGPKMPGERQKHPGLTNIN